MNLVNAAKKKDFAFDKDQPFGDYHGALDSLEGANLLTTLRDARLALHSLTQKQDVKAVTDYLRSLADPINRFIDGAMVMAEDEAVRSARLTLMYAATLQLQTAGDFTKLEG